MAFAFLASPRLKEKTNPITQELPSLSHTIITHRRNSLPSHRQKLLLKLAHHTPPANKHYSLRSVGRKVKSRFSVVKPTLLIIRKKHLHQHPQRPRYPARRRSGQVFCPGWKYCRNCLCARFSHGQFSVSSEKKKKKKKKKEKKKKKKNSS